MSHRITGLVSVLLGAGAALALPGPDPAQTIERVCTRANARTGDSRVRVPWTAIGKYHDVEFSYCVLHGDVKAKLPFERNAEIVYIGLASETLDKKPQAYTFLIITSSGRVIRQGPVLLQPVAKQIQSCRVEVCQFFTEPGERVLSVTVRPSS